MPALTSNLITSTYFRASDIPTYVWDALKSNPRDANVILPRALTSLAAEQSGGNHQQKEVWITCTSVNSHPTVEFVLSCTEGHMGSYPIFIFTTRQFDYLTDDYLRPRLEGLANALKDAVPIHRVYSVFAPEPITRLFVGVWTRLTGVKSYTNEPYYAANITYCTKRSFVHRQSTANPHLVYDLRPAVDSDIDEISHLCFAFAAESFPFLLTPQGALEEATSLVRSKQIWVHRVCRPGDSRSEIASIVAFTRNSDTVGAITKVFTNPNWRRLGCAERLVRRVCKHLLLTKESVVLYVAHDNRGAAKVYHRVGFCGLAQDCPRVNGVDPWLEIGFDRTQVRLGFW